MVVAKHVEHLTSGHNTLLLEYNYSCRHEPSLVPRPSRVFIACSPKYFAQKLCANYFILQAMNAQRPENEASMNLLTKHILL